VRKNGSVFQVTSHLRRCTGAAGVRQCTPPSRVAHRRQVSVRQDTD